MFAKVKQLLGYKTKWARIQAPEFTPDLWYLEQRRYHLVFACDETMYKHREYDLVGGQEAQLLCCAFTKDFFSLWKRNIGKASYAIPIADDTSAPKAPIKGELYKLSTEQIKELDKYKANTVNFVRMRVKLQIPYQILDIDSGNYSPEYVSEVKAWMYVGVLEEWPTLKQKSNIKYGEQVAISDNGGRMYSQVQLFIPNNPNRKKYYYFTVNEYLE